MPVYNKLVRDLIPDIITAQGKKCVFETLEPDAYHGELRKKLQEELQEYLSAATDQEASEELADLLEVIYALAAVHGVTEQELSKLRSSKRDKRGGFEKRILLIEADK